MPDAPPGRSLFEWDLKGSFLVQRALSPLPEYPDGLMIISLTPDGYLQHYFDSRGVVRLYEMSLEGQTWTLLRTEPDFSPLDFSQRFVGTISADGNRIEGAVGDLLRPWPDLGARLPAQLHPDPGRARCLALNPGTDSLTA